MTNYCDNFLRVTGSPSAMTNFAEGFLDENLWLDFGKIIPPPARLDGASLEIWKQENWQVTPERIYISERELTESSYRLDFQSPWGAPEAILRALAELCPQLEIDFIGIEEGNAYCFTLRSRTGFTEAENAFPNETHVTKAYGVSELARRRAADFDWWTAPSTLSNRPRRRLVHAWDVYQLRRKLRDYPIYEPPHKGLPALLEPSQAQENFEHLSSVVNRRIEVLASYLAGFGHDIDYSAETVVFLDRWLGRYAGLLFVEETRPSFFTHMPEWTEQRRSLNLMFDLCVFLGEYAMRETPLLSWGLDQSEPASCGHINEYFQRILLKESEQDGNRDFAYDIQAAVYRYCSRRCQATYRAKLRETIDLSQREATNFVTSMLRDIQLRASGRDRRSLVNRWP